MKQLQPRLTYANVVSTICLFMLLGGAAYAAFKLPKNSVGTKQIKNNSITGAKIKNGVITGSKINMSSLGTVPSASHASTADSATTAGTATKASTAESLAAPEAVHFVGAPGEPPFESGFEDGAGLARLGFYKDGQCVVHFVGDAKGASSGSRVFTLPEADRPAEESLAAVGVGGPNVGDVELHPDGLVIPFSGGSGTQVYGFAGLSFKAASC